MKKIHIFGQGFSSFFHLSDCWLHTRLVKCFVNVFFGIDLTCEESVQEVEQHAEMSL
jgi:hypothetical protein